MDDSKKATTVFQKPCIYTVKIHKCLSLLYHVQQHSTYNVLQWRIFKKHQVVLALNLPTILEDSKYLLSV